MKVWPIDPLVPRNLRLEVPVLSMNIEYPSTFHSESVPQDSKTTKLKAKLKSFAKAVDHEESLALNVKHSKDEELKYSESEIAETVDEVMEELERASNDEFFASPNSAAVKRAHICASYQPGKCKSFKNCNLQYAGNYGKTDCGCLKVGRRRICLTVYR